MKIQNLINMMIFFVTGRSKHVVPAGREGRQSWEGPRVPRHGRRHKRLERGKFKVQVFFF